MDFSSQMDCPICNYSVSPIILRPLRYTICGACYEGARSLIALINKLHNSNNDKGTSKANHVISSYQSSNKVCNRYWNSMRIDFDAVWVKLFVHSSKTFWRLRCVWADNVDDWLFMWHTKPTVLVRNIDCVCHVHCFLFPKQLTESTLGCK